MDNNAVALALIAIIGTVITALFKLLNDNTKALNKMTISSEKIAKETAKGNREAKERNGHLGEQNIQITKLVVAHGRELAEIRKSTQIDQVVDQQTVVHQTIESKE